MSPNFRRQRLVERIHRLGARVVFELLDEIAAVHGIGDDLDRRLRQYSQIDPQILVVLGGDRFPRRPLWSPSAPNAAARGLQS
jgi:hypothetical protein